MPRKYNARHDDRRRGGGGTRGTPVFLRVLVDQSRAGGARQAQTREESRHGRLREGALAQPRLVLPVAAVPLRRRGVAAGVNKPVEARAATLTGAEAVVEMLRA